MVDLLYPRLTRVRLTKNKNGRSTLSARLTRVRLIKNKNGRSTLSKINKSKVN